MPRIIPVFVAAVAGFWVYWLISLITSIISRFQIPSIIPSVRLPGIIPGRHTVRILHRIDPPVRHRRATAPGQTDDQH